MEVETLGVARSLGGKGAYALRGKATQEKRLTSFQRVGFPNMSVTVFAVRSRFSVV
jgi:hypothetical protein